MQDRALLSEIDFVAAEHRIDAPAQITLRGEIQKQRRELRAAGKPESEMEELFRKEREKEEKLFRSEKYAGRVGAFEGANYAATGYYRPEVNCIMFTRHDSFCAVCRRAIERVIGMYAG